MAAAKAVVGGHARRWIRLVDLVVVGAPAERTVGDGVVCAVGVDDATPAVAAIASVVVDGVAGPFGRSVAGHDAHGDVTSVDDTVLPDV